MASIPALSNPLSGSGFWQDALAWRGSITRRLIPRIALFTLYATAVAFAHTTLQWVGPDPIHLGYTGGFLAMMLIFRTNATYDRWWEARKLWGGIVNQSRNLCIKTEAALVPGGHRREAEDIIRWTACFGHAARMCLRSERDSAPFVRVLNDRAIAEQLSTAEHLPNAVAIQLARRIQHVHRSGTIDGFTFAKLEHERAMLLDHVGGCERILRTPVPRVHTITLRRFTLIYLIAVPLALATSQLWVAASAMALISYPLLAIDQIAEELENPFRTDRESHLALDTICARIEREVLDTVPAPLDVSD